eukprot:1612495-Rhodomonas_salina.1
MQKENGKRNNYLGTIIFLLQQYPGWEIPFHTFIMSRHTSVQEKVWMALLSNIGLKEHDMKKTIQACITECVIAFHKLYNTSSH